MRCSGNSSSTEAEEVFTGVPFTDPGPIHVHGLGINPADGSLFIATHTGLFRVGPNSQKALRIADRDQDTMGFSIVGPNRFLGSGHPDAREQELTASAIGQLGFAKPDNISWATRGPNVYCTSVSTSRCRGGSSPKGLQPSCSKRFVGRRRRARLGLSRRRSRA